MFIYLNLNTFDQRCQWVYANFADTTKYSLKNSRIYGRIKNNAIIRREEEKNSPEDGGTNNKTTVRVSKRQDAFFV
jgi:hypothetical protein